jgi:hypothetical protein
MPILIAYDAWFEGRIEALLRWLDNWLSISQKWAERGMIAIYVVLYLCDETEALALIALRLSIAFFLAMIMWHLHRSPAAMRGRRKRVPFYPLIRVGFQLLMCGSGALASQTAKSQRETISLMAMQIVYIVFFYATDIAFDGESGRKRKLAWEKIHSSQLPGFATENYEL